MARILISAAVLLTLLGTAPLQVPNPGTSPEPAATSTPDFPFIGRTRSKRYCSLETERTNGAITVALLNDKIISAGIGTLRQANLDRPEITTIEREKVMRDLRAVAAALQTNMRAGDAQLVDIRALSVKEPDAVRSPELKLFADRLADALGTQRSIGSDLAKMLTIVEGRRAAGQSALEASAVVPQTAVSRSTNGLPPIDQRATYEPLNSLFNDVADEFGDRTVAIGKSEDAAAAHAPRALNGC